MASNRVYGINFGASDTFYLSGYFDPADGDQLRRAIQVMFAGTGVADVSLYLSPKQGRALAAELLAAADAVDAAATSAKTGTLALVAPEGETT